MADSMGKQLLENSRRPDIVVPPAPPEPRKQPPGTVERILNVRERNYIVGVCLEFTKKNPGHKSQIKVARVKDVVVFEETLKYIDMINDAYEEKAFQWRVAMHEWKNCRDYQAGMISLETFRKACPNVNLDIPREKPPRQHPEASPEELRGPESSFYFPPKIDVWVQECLKASAWEGVQPEYVVELCGKYGITDES